MIPIVPFFPIAPAVHVDEYFHSRYTALQPYTLLFPLPFGERREAG